MTAADWIKAINEAEGNEVLRLWNECLNRCCDNEANEITLAVHKACVDKVLNTIGFPRDAEAINESR